MLIKTINIINISYLVIYLVIYLGVLSLLRFSTKIIQVYVYVCVYLLYVNIISTGHHLSIYYFIVGLLNTKYNILLIFLVSIIFLNFLKKNPKKTPLTTFIILLYINIMPGTVNTNVFSNIISLSTVNTNLLNGLMLIHPVLLYLFYILYLVYTYNLLVLSRSTHIKLIYDTQVQSVFLMLIVSYTSLILGCFWAEQELAWGGWWSWDFVELIALNFFIYMLYSVHSPKGSSIVKFSSVYHPGKIILVMVSAVLVVRFNIINSIHNFISIESQNQYYYYIILILLCSITTLLFSYHPLIKGRYAMYPIFLKKINSRFVYPVIFNPKTLLVLTIWVFYILFIYNILGSNLTFIKYNTQTNTKHILLVMLLLTITWYFVKNTNFFINVIFVIILYIKIKSVFFVVLCIITFLWQKLRFITLNKTFNRFIWEIHFTLLLYLLVCMSQTYIFNTLSVFQRNDLLENLKSSYIIVVQHSTGLYNSIELFVDNLLNLDTVGGSPSKQVFEKDVKLLTNSFYETYSYNSQNLHQPIGLCIFTTLTYLLYRITLLSSFVQVVVL